MKREHYDPLQESSVKKGVYTKNKGSVPGFHPSKTGTLSGGPTSSVGRFTPLHGPLPRRLYFVSNREEGYLDFTVRDVEIIVKWS